MTCRTGDRQNAPRADLGASEGVPRGSTTRRCDGGCFSGWAHADIGKAPGMGRASCGKASSPGWRSESIPGTTRFFAVFNRSLPNSSARPWVGGSHLRDFLVPAIGRLGVGIARDRPDLQGLNPDHPPRRTERGWRVGERTDRDSGHRRRRVVDRSDEKASRRIPIMVRVLRLSWGPPALFLREGFDLLTGEWSGEDAKRIPDETRR